MEDFGKVMENNSNVEFRLDARACHIILMPGFLFAVEEGASQTLKIGAQGRGF